MGQKKKSIFVYNFRTSTTSKFLSWQWQPTYTSQNNFQRQSSDKTMHFLNVIVIVTVSIHKHSSHHTTMTTWKHACHACWWWLMHPNINPSGGLVVRASASRLGGRGFEPRPGHTKDFKNGTYCFLVRCSAFKNGEWKLNTHSVPVD